MSAHRSLKSISHPPPYSNNQSGRKMSFDEAVRPNERGRYEGEDTSPTTTRELNGWYSYPIAAEVYAVVAVGAFLPVLLEQLARENGVFFSDRTKPCIETGSTGNVNQVQPRGDDGHNGQCVINLLGMELTSASFAMYTSSIAVLVQAVTLICFSSFADHGPYRKRMLMTFAYTGSIASSLFIFITPKVYYLAPLLVIVGITCLGSSFVLLNAFLPLLVAHHPENPKLATSDSSSDFELEALNPESEPNIIHRSNPEKLARDLKRSSQISSKGVGLGYISAVFVQCLSILIIIFFDKTSLSKNNPSLPIRVSMLMSGIWWAIFTIPTYLWLRPRPGPPLPTQTKLSLGTRKLGSTFIFYTAFSLRSFWATLKRAIRLRQTLLFLCAWFLISDAVATIAGTAVLFARTELKMGTIAIALLSITSIGSGIVGAFTWPRIAARYSLQSKTVLFTCLIGLEFIPLYGLLGYIPLFQKLGFIGLQNAWEIYPVAVVHGISMGGISSYARSVFAPLIPEGREAAFFALYAVTDKGSSAVGPALVGWIVDRAGTIRPAFGFLAVLVAVPMPLIWRLNVEKGREDAARMAEGRRSRVRDFDD